VSAAPAPLIADLFRREYARLVALLARRAGAQHIDRVEDAVQDALLAALRHWPIDGVPRQPSAWLLTAARNAYADRVRKHRREVPCDEPAEAAPPAAADAAHEGAFGAERAFDDDQLRLMLYCCHPALPAEQQLALTLRLACGLSVEEIAAALFVAAPTIAQRLVRAKRRLREAGVEFELPPAAELAAQRLPVMLDAIYLLFNAGYLSPESDVAHRPNLCADALRFADGLAALPATALPRTQALAALLHLLAARLPARRTADGRLLRLEEQERARWDHGLLAAGLRHFAASCRGEELTRFHVEAAIAACHARAPTFADTDWDEILAHYDQLVALFPSPAAHLSRLIALRHAHGAAAALLALEASHEMDALEGQLLMHATRAEFHAAAGDPAQAEREYRLALARVRDPQLRALLEARLR